MNTAAPCWATQQLNAHQTRLDDQDAWDAAKEAHETKEALRLLARVKAHDSHKDKLLLSVLDDYVQSHKEGLDVVYTAILKTCRSSLNNDNNLPAYVGTLLSDAIYAHAAGVAQDLMTAEEDASLRLEGF